MRKNASITTLNRVFYRKRSVSILERKPDVNASEIGTYGLENNENVFNLNRLHT